jgi:cation diffusion facilitator family transporter
MNDALSVIHATKEKAALASIGASALLTIGKLVAGLLTGSLALISEAGHALLDTGATILTYFAVRAAHKPADDEHHYGHGKIEAVAALAETGLLAVLAVGVAFEAVRRLMGHAGEPVDANWIAFAVLGASIVIDLTRWYSLSKIARETKSDALAADALHFSSDLVGSVCVVLGLIGVRLGFPQADAFAALGVSLFIGIAGFRLGRKTIDTLVDAAPKGLADRLRDRALSIGGVVNVDTLRLRPAGPDVIGELQIRVPRTMPLERVAIVKQSVADAMADEAPEAKITVTADPIALDDESVLELVLLIAARRRVPVHHVTVQDIDRHKSVSLDVELDGRMSLGQAHEIVSGLEDAIQAELGPEVEVETHIEPLEIAELAGRDVSDVRGPDIARILADAAASGGIISDVHQVRVRETPTGLVVNYHCHASEFLSVEAVHHAVDQLDHRLRSSVHDVSRVVGHAEPLH